MAKAYFLGGVQGLGLEALKPEWGLGFRVLGFRVWGLGFSLGFRARCLEPASGIRQVRPDRVKLYRRHHQAAQHGMQDLGFRVQGFGFRVSGLAFRV